MAPGSSTNALYPQNEITVIYVNAETLSAIQKRAIQEAGHKLAKQKRAPNPFFSNNGRNEIHARRSAEKGQRMAAPGCQHTDRRLHLAQRRT